MPLHNCAILLTRPMFSDSNSCLNKRAYQKLKEAGYRKLKDATYQKIKEVDYRRLKESAYQIVNEADSLKDFPADGAVTVLENLPAVC